MKCPLHPMNENCSMNSNSFYFTYDLDTSIFNSHAQLYFISPFFSISFILSIIMHILQSDNFCYFCVNIAIELNSLAYTWLSYHVSIFNLIFFNFCLTN